MLEPQEIQRLEKLYESYKKKNGGFLHKIFNAKNSKILIIELLLIIILLAALIALSIEKTPSLASKSDKFLAKNATAVKMVEKNETNASMLSELKQKSEVAKAKFEEGKKQDELADKIAKKLEEVVKINETNDTLKNDPKRQRSSQGWLKLNIPDEEPLTEQNGISVPQDEVIDLESKPARKRVNIQVTSASNEESMLREQFLKTNNPTIALELARLNFRNNNFKEAIKWSLAANDIDNSLEESWIIFAKSKYKLKQSDDAVKALMEYNKNLNKASINELINKIKSGTL
ncbi:CDC27 family protein [Campylobacter concisus]|uniref:CDC27 family protein n=1 Tax=Campylobacter concisus TaxID=199 RepID=UPI000CD87FF2|nr:CDC27 family protein [Campylobacter concisus]MCA6130131.1 CDC27 family protein [Campylobacter concisus]MCA6131966.1 CDC27 family protein [Campylobacter concisus]